MNTAAEAGIYKGDVLTEVDGRTITSSTALMKEMTYHKSGETIEMKVLRADNGEYKEQDADFVFSTNVTMANSLELFEPHTWDYIIIDECHHATAETYRRIINYFEPQFLLGITATPERRRCFQLV